MLRLLPALLLAGCPWVRQARDIDAPSPELEVVVEGNTAFALDVYAWAAAHDEGNLFLSPFSISSALSMAAAGAEGATEEQLASVLHMAGDEADWHASFGALTRDLDGDQGRGYTLNIANRLFAQEGFAWEPSFLDVQEIDYGAPLEELDFSGDPERSRERINRWVDRRTEGLIEELLGPGSVTPLTRLVLANAIYFQGDWLHPFDDRDTEQATFHAPAGDVAVPMMFQHCTCSLATHDEVSVLRLPYEDDEVSMVVLLPVEEDGLAAVEAALSLETLARWTSGAERLAVAVTMPKWEVRSRLELQNALSDLGMPLAFDPVEADFTGMHDEPGAQLSLSEVVHEAVVRVDELGTEAAAATGIVIRDLSGTEYAPFSMDHPFLYLLMDDLTGSVLFMGRVVDPS